MDKAEAKRRFDKADKLFTYGRFDDVLVELALLDQHFPNNHRILNARARTLEQLGRYDEALAVCDRLLNDFQYEKIRSFRDGVAHSLKHQGNTPPKQPPPGVSAGSTPPPLPGAPRPPEFGATSPDKPKKKNDPESKKRMRKILLRVLLLFALGGLMFYGYLPYWLGGGIIAVYSFFLLVVWFVKRKLKQLFTAPFKMKGKALAGAGCELHGIQWTEKPANIGDDVDDDEEDDNDAPREPGRFVWLDVTITPQPNPGGFTHWEPGELMLAPLHMEFNGLDDLDRCFPIRDFKLADGAARDEEDEEYDDAKFAGPLRLRVLAEVPHHENAFKFVYYFEQFGELHLA